VTSVGSGEAAEALGLTATAVGDTLTGGRLTSGLNDTLVRSLRGGAGLGTLGTVDITNRNNVVSNVDLSAAETLGEIVDEINSQAVGVTARGRRCEQYRDGAGHRHRRSGHQRE
jgi:hypothetical protein